MTTQATITKPPGETVAYKWLVERFRNTWRVVCKHSDGPRAHMSTQPTEDAAVAKMAELEVKYDGGAGIPWEHVNRAGHIQVVEEVTRKSTPSNPELDDEILSMREQGMSWTGIGTLVGMSQGGARAAAIRAVGGDKEDLPRVKVKVKRVPRQGVNRRTPASADDRDREAAKMRDAGNTFRQIADALDFPYPQAARAAVVKARKEGK